MALAATTVFEIRGNATAGNLNGGGFNPSNANMLTDLACDTNTGNTTSPIVSSASYTFLSRDVGAKVYIKAGTNWTVGWYSIVAVSGGKATLDASVGAVSVVSANQYTVNTVVGVATVATPTGGTFAVDYSQMAASPFASTDIASTDGTTTPSTITSAANPYGPQMAGNIIHITAGTNWTAGWYEIVSVATVTATLDRAVGTSATLTSGTGYAGGALSLGAANDDAVFELGVASSTAAMRYFIKGGYTYAITSVSVSAAGNAAQPIRVEGYSSYRGDRPKPKDGSLQPLLDVTTGGFGPGTNWRVTSLAFTGTSSNVATVGTGNIYVWCKSVNTSTTAARNAFFASGGTMIGCEGISLRGNGVAAGSGAELNVIGCVFRDSDKGVSVTTGRLMVLNCVVSNNVTAAIHVNGANTAGIRVVNSTLRGSTTRIGIGLYMATGCTNIVLAGCNIHGFVTGVSHADANTIGLDMFNNYYNNTNDNNSSSNWQKGLTDTAYGKGKQLTGTTATTSNTGNTLVDAGATFLANGVTAGRDFVYISSTSGTVGMYSITSVDSETQLTLGVAPGVSSGNVTYFLTPGATPYPELQKPDYLLTTPAGVGFDIEGSYALVG